MKMDGRPPSHNLLRDGYEECAEFVAGVIKNRGQTHQVFVDSLGGVRTRAVDAPHTPLPTDWFVGTYPCKDLRVELIENDLIERTRELSA